MKPGEPIQYFFFFYFAVLVLLEMCGTTIAIKDIRGSLNDESLLIAYFVDVFFAFLSFLRAVH
jgi:hypothetical protein